MSYKNRAENAIGQGTTTNSKHWNSHVKGVYPTHIKASTGPYLIDTENKKYVDFAGGLGTNLLGYGHPLIESEVEKYRHQGKSPSLPHILEVEVAEKLKQCFSWTQRWKFLKTGTEATLASLRMARAYTERNVILSEYYHGWADIFTSLTPPAKGVPPHEYIKPLTLEYLTKYPLSVAAIITEPIAIDASKERIDYLNRLRRICDENGILLIFDEIITGFRYKSLSVSKHYNVIPDLITIGKACGNGYPLAAVGGPKEILDNDYFVSSTYAGEITALAACNAVIDTIRTKPEFHIDRLWEAGEKFLKGFNEASKELSFHIEGYPTRGVFKGNEENIALFFQEACLAGILFGKSWFISHSHIPLLENTLESCKDIILKMSKTKPKLLGELPRSPFSMKARK